MKRAILRCWIGTVLVMGILQGPLWSQNEVRFQILPVEQAVAPGGRLVLTLRATMAPTWHLYSLTPYPDDVLAAPQPTTIQLKDHAFFESDGKVRQPTPKTDHDENFGIETEYFDGIVDFDVPVRVASTASAGEHEVILKIRFMACNDRLCLPPRNIEAATLLTVSTGSAALSTEFRRALNPVAAPETEMRPPLAAEGRYLPERGAQLPPASAPGVPTTTLAYILFAMAGGGLALLTPCVFPMIPITVSYFTKRDVGRRQALQDAALYSLGIILTFTLLGFALTRVFGAGGINRVAASPVVNIAIAALFIVFALNLFGAIELRLPSGWLTAVDKKSSAVGGATGILLMALAFSLTSFTCTVPFVGTVMVAATRGDWLWSLLGVSAFATVFAAPFFFLALFPSLLKSLPKAGSWMSSMKVTMGFLELAAAMKFISNVDLVFQWELITRPVFITVWLGVALVLTLYLLGHFSFPHEDPAPRVGAGRVLSAIFFLSVSFYLLRGLFGASLGELDAFLPPRDYGVDQWAPAHAVSVAGSGQTEQQRWLTDYGEALQRARAKGKPIFVDFTGYTCTNCRWMEANIFVRPRVRALFDKYVLVRLYTDGGKPEHEANLRMEQDRFRTIALPLYALMTPGDQIIATFPGLTRSEGAFVSFLEQGLATPPVLALKE